MECLDWRTLYEVMIEKILTLDGMQLGFISLDQLKNISQNKN